SPVAKVSVRRPKSAKSLLAIAVPSLHHQTTEAVPAASPERRIVSGTAFLLSETVIAERAKTNGACAGVCAFGEAVSSGTDSATRSRGGGAVGSAARGAGNTTGAAAWLAV